MAASLSSLRQRSPTSTNLYGYIYNFINLYITDTLILSRALKEPFITPYLHTLPTKSRSQRHPQLDRLSSTTNQITQIALTKIAVTLKSFEISSIINFKS